MVHVCLCLSLSVSVCLCLVSLFLLFPLFCLFVPLPLPMHPAQPLEAANVPVAVELVRRGPYLAPARPLCDNPSTTRTPYTAYHQP